VRLGCSGCLTFLLCLALLGGSAWMATAILAIPEVPAQPAMSADGLRAQQKLYELLARSGRARREGAVALTEQEVSAFLDRHLGGASDLPLRRLVVRLPGEGTVELLGTMPLRALVRETPLAGPVAALPSVWSERPVWLRLRGRLRTEESAVRRYLRLDVERLTVGRQRLPVLTLRLLLDPTTLGLLRWPLPGAIRAITAERSRIVIAAEPPP
jgi:hypothetical protein